MEQIDAVMQQLPGQLNDPLINGIYQDFTRQLGQLDPLSAALEESDLAINWSMYHIKALVAFLRTVPPVSRPSTPKKITVPMFESVFLPAWLAAFAPVGWPAHSGHLIPTAAKTMHSGQIGRPQFEHVTAVSLRGWR